jgi:hypothetical protein
VVAPPATTPLATAAHPNEPVAPDVPCVEPEAAAIGAQTRRGIDEYVSGSVENAQSSFESALSDHPDDRTAALALGATRKRIDFFRTLAELAIEQTPAVRLAPITLDRQPGHASFAGQRVVLAQASAQPNQTTDQQDWYRRNGLERRTGLSGNHLPAHVAPKARGSRLGGYFRNQHHDVALYGSLLVVTAPGKSPRVLDTSSVIDAIGYRLSIHHAAMLGDLLVLQFAYNGYAKESGGKNGYLAAFDATKGRVIWVSDPLVGNLTNFVVMGSSIITGYGFTSERCSLNLVDASTGEVTQRLALGSSPQEIIAKDARLHVRTTQVDYVFAPTTGSLPAAPPPNLGPSAQAPAEAAPPAPPAGCWIRSASRALARDDLPLVRRASVALKGLGERFFAAVLELEASRGPAAARPFFLESAPPIRVAEPGWPGPSQALPVSGSPSLVRVTRAKASPSASSPQPFDGRHTAYIAMSANGALPTGAPPEIPTAYGLTPLRAIIPSGDRLVLIYGDRYVASTLSGRVERIFDLDGLRHPPNPDPKFARFAVQEVTHAAVDQNRLYVCNGGGSYARDVHGKKGYVTQIDLDTGKVLWRSAPLVCNAEILLLGDLLVTGYGFTHEPDALYLLHTSDGTIAARAQIEASPEKIDLEAGQIRVETDKVVLTYAVRR